jgi:hypothetical protein
MQYNMFTRETNVNPASSNPFNNFQAGGTAGYRGASSFANLGAGNRENTKYLNSPISHPPHNQEMDKSPRGGINHPIGQAYNPLAVNLMSLSGTHNMMPFGSQPTNGMP